MRGTTLGMRGEIRVPGLAYPMLCEALMHSQSGATESLWMDGIHLPQYPSLSTEIRTEVCVIGAGVAGLTTAYLLVQAGKKVTVIDSRGVGDGETSRTTAHLTAALDNGYRTIINLHGEEHARMAAESQMAAIDQIERIVKKEGIACDFERVLGYLFPKDPRNEDDQKIVEQELEATHLVGITNTRIESVPIARNDWGDAVCYSDQAQFHPLKYLAGVTQAIVRDGGVIYGGTRAVDVVYRDEQVVVTTRRGHPIIADDVVIATNAPINEGMALYARQAPYRSYVVGFRIPAGSVPRVLLWDTGKPYHYVRVQPGATTNGDDILIIGGEDHKSGQGDDTDDRFDLLEQWTRARFSMVQDVVYRWSGQVMRSNDALAYLGRSPGDGDHVYVITGDCCNGITNATIGAMVISDLIKEVPNQWAECYDPRRIRVKSVVESAKENANVIGQYAAWLLPGDVDDVDEIAPGSGAVIRSGLQKLAVYKALDGTVVQCSAVCTHRHCIVDWNDTEKTWDCPCHGSRFDAYGKVVNGPAVEDLERLQ